MIRSVGSLRSREHAAGEPVPGAGAADIAEAGAVVIGFIVGEILHDGDHVEYRVSISTSMVRFPIEIPVAKK